MKKIIVTFLFLIMISFVGRAAFCADKSNKYKENKIVLNGVNFSVDPRIELFHTMEVLAGVPITNFIDLDYKQKIVEHLSPFKTHPLFAYLGRNPLYGKLFTTIDGPIWFMLHMTPELDWRKDIPVSEQENAGLDSLRVLMKDFSVKADYATFFNSNSDLYQISLATRA